MAEGSELSTIDTGAMANVSKKFDWVGLDPSQIKSVAQAMAISGMFPDVARDGAKAFVKIMAGQEMGISPFQAMSDISIISGKAAAGGNIHASKVKSHPKYDYRVKQWDNTGCAIEFFELMGAGKRESLGISEFTKADAEAAGLLSNANYKKYPRNMFYNRAMTNGVRTFCPDALNGVNAYSPEELGATVDEDGHVTAPAPAAAPAPARNKADAPEAEVVRPQDVIKEIGAKLNELGFDDSADRQQIALTMAGVEKISQASADQWQEVLDNINVMNADELRQMISPAEEDAVNDEPQDTAAAFNQTPEAEVVEDEPVVEDTPQYVKPEIAKGSSPLPKPAQLTFAKQMYEVLGLKSAAAIKGYIKGAIDKDSAATFDDFDLLISQLVDDANENATQTGLGV